jgi:signal peptidase I
MHGDISELRSSYYPPRARWFARARLGWRRFELRWRGLLPGAVAPVSLFQALLGVLVPGMGFGVYGRPLLARVVAGLWLVAAVSFFLLLSVPPVVGMQVQFDPAFIAAGLAAGLHGMSVSFFAQRFWGWETPGRRVAMGVLATGAVLALLYLPLGNWLRHHVAWPITHGQTRLVINPESQPAAVRRGDWILFKTPRRGVTGVIAVEGLQFGPVVALPGERVEFRQDAVWVNGVRHERLDGMPETGGLNVPADCWLAWPDLRVQRYAVVNPGAIESLRLELAQVPWTNFIGKPYARWFFSRPLL